MFIMNYLSISTALGGGLNEWEEKKNKGKIHTYVHTIPLPKWIHATNGYMHRERVSQKVMKGSKL